MTISKDYGRFLASLMKKDFNKPVGIDYIAVGGPNIENVVSDPYFNEVEFGKRVKSFFDSFGNEKARLASEKVYNPPEQKGLWVWARPIEKNKIILLDDEKSIPKLSITASFGSDKPFDVTLAFREFALLGIALDGDNFTDKIYFIDYFSHPVITKDKDMTLTREIILRFPAESPGK